MTTFILFSRHDPEGAAAGGNELAYQLRGGPIWALGGNVAAPKSSGAVAIPSARRDHLVFTSLPFLVDNPAILDQLLQLGVPIIIDVHFPFGRRDQMLAIQPDTTDETRDPALDEMAADYWTQPETVAKALRVLAVADVITSPRQDWADLVDPLVRAPVMVLPDVVSVRSGVRFVRRFMRVSVYALGGGWQATIGVRVAGWLMSRSLRQRLAALNINWSARKAGIE